MKRSGNNLIKILVIVVLVCIVFTVGFIFLSPSFEKDKPIIKFTKKMEFWNLQDPLKLKISDKSGIKYYKITYKDGKNEVVLEDKILKNNKKDLNLVINPPKLNMFFKGKDVSIIVEAVDNSKWHFFEGNSVKKEFKIKIDKKAPIANVIRNSYAIRHGGSAVVVVQVKDKNLKDAYILFNNKERFELIPFYKPNFYISLIAWPVSIKKFDRVNLVAVDKADNKTFTKIPLYIRKLKPKNENINISDSFIKNTSVKLLEENNLTVPNSMKDIFIKQNRLLRKMNTDLIRKIGIKFMDKELISSFNIKPFKRLEGSKTFAYFAERRHYYYKGEKIDEQWHLGIDWASIRHASIRVTNPGKVIFNDYLGIYGHTIIVDHKLGLQTLYAHTSRTDVRVGSMLKANAKIANTGTTGAVLGDHLHFGVLIQGVEVNPLEWMDKNWIKTLITNVIKEAKGVINSETKNNS